ncbi:MAG: AsmA-like C-terminal domain-containing protein, partial [Phycisphaerales bacterium]|nr:AsmA-like C-terminal domain-containing protein [Phycisphaerales bacterium]
AGARFAPLIAVLARPDGEPKPADAAPTALVEGDESRGRLDATLSVQGISGDHESRQGTGSLRIADGNVVELPLLVPLIQLSNFQVPIGDELDYAQAQFTLVGRRLLFEQIAVMSESISILGAGFIDLPDLGLDLRFTSQSANRLPLISDLLELVRDEILTTRVTGTLRDPSFETEVLGGTRRMLASLFGSGEDDVAPLSPEAEEAARRQRNRREFLMDGASPAPRAPTARPGRRSSPTR